MQWWCVARPEVWSWTWRPLLGVWLVVALMALGYRRIVRRTVDAGGDGPERWRVGCLVAALVLLWASLDWPVGPLGASYFASVHMVQFLVVGIGAPALLLLGVPPDAFDGLLRRPRTLAVLEAVTHPVIAFVIFNAIMTASHWPGVVDALMPTQAGSFILDLVWFVGGLILWWPVIAPVPVRPRFHPLAKIGYLAFNAFLIRPPFAMMIFSEHPIYAIYELAPPPAGDPLNDQQLAGAIMKIGSAWIMFAGVLVVFSGWLRGAESGAERGSDST